LIGVLHVMRTGGNLVWACLLLTFAVAGLHFTGMAAIRLMPATGAVLSPLILSPQIMTDVVGGAAALVMAICIAVLVHARLIDKIVRVNDRRFAILAKGISDYAVFMLTPGGAVASWNVGAERLKGYTEAEVIGSPLETFYTPEDRAAGVPGKILATAFDQGMFHGEGWRCRKDGSRFWAHIMIEPIHDEAGSMIGFAKIIRDMTQVKEDQDQLSAMQAQRDTALDNMAQGLVLFDADQRLLLANHSLCDLWQVPLDSVRAGFSLTELLNALLDGRAVADRAFVMARLQQLLTPIDGQMVDTVVLDCHADFALSLSYRRLSNGGWVATFTDITERRRDEARIAHMALHDLLTGLPNREGIGKSLDANLAQAAAEGTLLATVLIDIDALRAINDRYGHQFGDSVLRQFAQRLAAVCPGEERIARAGDDEFIANLTFTDPAELHDFLGQLRACLALPVVEGDLVMPVSVAIGVALFPAHGRDRGTLFNNADLALQRAKAQHGDRLCIYDPAMDEDQRNRRQLAEDLRGAVERGEMRLLFQPQHRLASGALTGYEALVRWQHPTRGEISPSLFIPIAEDTGEIFAIGEWVLREAARIAATWSADLKVAVNLSPVQFEQEDLLQRITAVLLDTGLPTSRLELEITESAMIADRARALHMLRRIKALGISIAIDDFGTGHASLDTLHVFPFDKIKIDQLFLRQSTNSRQSAAIVQAVLALGRGLGIPVLAEGIETEAQLAFLIAEGCELGQGYLFGRPQVVGPDEGLRRAG
jgi:diguanylate cyclase (GGDEF)-like protein/PAS domain S-box-containing protein